MATIICRPTWGTWRPPGQSLVSPGHLVKPWPLHKLYPPSEKVQQRTSGQKTQSARGLSSEEARTPISWTPPAPAQNRHQVHLVGAPSWCLWAQPAALEWDLAA